MKFLYFGFLIAFNLFEISFSAHLRPNSLQFLIERDAVNNDRVPQCHSEIYCHGQLLDKIQMAKLYADSKHFVDMKLKLPPNETMSKFQEMLDENNQNPDFAIIEKFVNDHFHEPGAEFEKWYPSDWKDSPRFLDLISDPDFRKWAHNLHTFWKELGRQMVKDVAVNPDLYSIIHVENPVIVPGGRFREFYYWDSYWIIRGLLYSEMYETAHGMLKNFLSIINRFGFIPNGGRIYYSKRSQPPLLAAMIKSYVEVTGDDKFAIDAVETLEHEFQFWMNNHTFVVNGHQLAAYGDKSSGPRPESYREDILTSANFTTEEEKQEHYSELKAAAESGMDFSSRWFIDADGNNTGSLPNLKTRSIIPVELNAILFWNAQIIAEFYVKAGNLLKAAEYEKKAQDIYEAIQAVLWHEDLGTWLDYDMINNKRRNYFVPTNLSPLWMKCYNISDSDHIAKKVLAYINSTGIDKYPGGVPNTLSKTGEQWDFPNVWPPMQYILIVGLENLGTNDTKNLALEWASRWVSSNYKAYAETDAMFEKYNAEVFGGHGSGGEYGVQLGFGWTNGVILELLAKYGNKLTPAGMKGGSLGYKNMVFSGIITAFVAIFATTVGRFIW